MFNKQFPKQSTNIWKSEPMTHGQTKLYQRAQGALFAPPEQRLVSPQSALDATPKKHKRAKSAAHQPNSASLSDPKRPKYYARTKQTISKCAALPEKRLVVVPKAAEELDQLHGRGALQQRLQHVGARGVGAHPHLRRH